MKRVSRDDCECVDGWCLAKTQDSRAMAMVFGNKKHGPERQYDRRQGLHFASVSTKTFSTSAQFSANDKLTGSQGMSRGLNSVPAL